MSTIPTHLSEEQFEMYVNPYLSKAKRGYISKIPLYRVFNYLLYKLHTGCQWKQIAISKASGAPEKCEVSPSALHAHFHRWSEDGSLKKVWQGSIQTIKQDINISEISLDGTHTLAKKGVNLSLTRDARKRRQATYCPSWMRMGTSLLQLKLLPETIMIFST